MPRQGGCVRTKVIVNPAAGRGGCARLWPGIEARLERQLNGFDVAMTARPGDEIGLARDALQQGYDHFVAVGGDGTVNGVLNGVMADGALANPATVLSVVPAGTANELARELGFHADIDGAIAAAGGGRLRTMDLLAADCAGLDGTPVRHYGYLAISWGGAAEISHRTSTSRYLKKLGGRFSYYMVTLIVTLTYPNQTCRLAVDDGAPDDVLHYSGLICNTAVLGGGMRLAPGADSADGIADLVLFRDIPRREMLLQKPSWLFEGHHIEHDKVDLIRGRHFAVTGPAEELIDADGETIGRLPLEVRVLPQALRVTC